MEYGSSLWPRIGWVSGQQWPMEMVILLVQILSLILSGFFTFPLNDQTLTSPSAVYQQC